MLAEHLSGAQLRPALHKIALWIVGNPAASNNRLQVRASAQVSPVNVLQQQHPTARPSQQSAERCLDAVSMKAAARCPTLAVFRRRLEVTDGSVRDRSAARRPGRGMRGERRRRRPLRASVSCRGGIARGCAVSQVRDKARNRRSTRRRGDRLPANNRPSAFRSAECACVYPM